MFNPFISVILQPVVGGENGTLSPLPTVNSGSSVPESGNGSGSGVTVAPPTSQPYATMSPLGTPGESHYLLN